MLAALKRTEAGALFSLGGYPSTTEVREHPWLIKVVQAETEVCSIAPEGAELGIDHDLCQLLELGLNFTYAHPEATQAPSKQTATQRKGRMKDQEAAENAQEQRPFYRAWRKPSFVESPVTKTEPLAYGNALHRVLQYVDYQRCGSVEALSAQLSELISRGILTEDQADMVDCKALMMFFKSPIGQQLCCAEHVLREFKFSILDDGSSYGDGLEDEKILLQGVVDCAILDQDGITVIDFKTDRISVSGLDMAVQNYRYQLQAYADALARIYDKPVKRACLYFFSLNQCIDI